jgi:hypothetical protein
MEKRPPVAKISSPSPASTIIALLPSLFLRQGRRTPQPDAALSVASA